MKHWKILRIHKGEPIESAPTTRLKTLVALTERLQKENPNDKFSIVDTDNNPVQSIDKAAADLAHPVAKAKRKQAALDDEYKAMMNKKVRRL